MKYALVTGACGGLANAVIQNIKDDFFLILTDINPAINEKYKDLPYKLLVSGDLTKKETVEHLFNEISKVTDHLDLVMHFAGLLEIGPLTEVSIDAFKS